MVEERKLAEEGKYESPVWETIEDTHKCYNENLDHLLDTVNENDAVFIASHNMETVERAMKKIQDRNIKD